MYMFDAWKIENRERKQEIREREKERKKEIRKERKVRKRESTKEREKERKQRSTSIPGSFLCLPCRTTREVKEKAWDRG